MKCLITVTEEDIKKGRQRSADSCPVARAIKRKFNAVEASWYYRAGSYQYRAMSGILLSNKVRACSKKVTKFVSAFDTSRKSFDVKPFKFYVEVS